MFAIEQAILSFWSERFYFKQNQQAEILFTTNGVENGSCAMLNISLWKRGIGQNHLDDQFHAACVCISAQGIE